MPFWNRNKSEAEAGAPARLEQLVAEQLPDADAATVQLVAAVAGLLACVAFSDRALHAAEHAHVLEVLRRVQGMSASGARAICALLESHATELTRINPQAYTRTLRELAERQMRLEVLDALIELAAIDGELAFEETQLLRRLTSALALEQADYNAAQARQLERLHK
jgi:uncharacterized tellurite resistance protein B-like protein